VLCILLPLALDGDERSASHMSHFSSGQRALGTHWLRRFMGPRATLNMMSYSGPDDTWVLDLVILMKQFLQPNYIML
jgi:hypothetical protein